MRPHRFLASAEVGSFLWRMDHPGSDHDIMAMHMVDTIDLLAGRCEADGSKVTMANGNIDTASHEAGKWVRELLKGNLNFVVALYSDVDVRDPQGHLALLRRVYTPAKNLAPSLRGCVYALIKDAERHDEKWVGRRAKKLKTALRTLQFGATWMYQRRAEFVPASYDVGASDEDLRRLVDERLDIFNRTVENSTLPERPSEEPLREWLLQLRLADLHRLHRVEDWCDADDSPRGCVPKDVEP